MASRLCLQNTLTRRKEIFTPRQEDGTVKMFTCGPSIYAWPHLGNYRTFLFEDVLHRYLEYLGYNVDRLLNFTDVEDKAISEAARRGIGLDVLTRPVADRFFEDCDRLNIKLQRPIPRSSTSVGQAAHLIERLLEKGYAYRYGQDVFYDPLKFKDFGKLYGLDMSRWPKKKVRFYKDTYPGQRWNLGDFILWKGRRPSDGDVYWETSLGEGRPSWNIQDPAMISKQLGFDVDICCGGVDNLYRHHDYNIAVMEGVSGEEFCRYWLHGQLVLVDGIKMSKSRGNIVYLQDLIDTGYDYHHLRFFLTYRHYRAKLNLCEEELHLARGKVDTFREMFRRLARDDSETETEKQGAGELIDRLRPEFEARMNEDLDVKGAFDAIFQITTELVRIQSRGGLGKTNARLATDHLKKIDSVWQILL